MKKMLNEENRSPDRAAPVTIAKQSSAQPIQRRKNVHPKPDYRFEGLTEAEYEPCFQYEIRRERIPKRRASLMEQAAKVDACDDTDGEKFRQKLELQRELDEVKRAERPWLKLTKAERQTHLKKEPVQLANEVKPGERWLRKKRVSGPHADIELFIDFTYGNEVLVASFQRLLTKMRKEGMAQFTAPGRPNSIKLRLFSLSAYRCLRRGMQPDEVWKHLTKLREKFWIGEQQRTKLPELAMKIERVIGGKTF